MMGLGYWGNGGSSSSVSNLSALAPPFTVDRSNPKPNSNPLVNFTEPPYGAPYNPSLNPWQYPQSSTSRPNLFPNPESEIEAIRTNCVPSVKDYPYSVPQSINSSSTHWTPSNPNAKSERDGLSYIPYSDDVPTGLLESKPYYPPYVSPVVEDDNQLLPFNEPSFDLLSTSHVVPFLGPSQRDYTQSLSGLEYGPKWGGFWNGLTDGGRERSKRGEVDGIFGSEDMNVAGSYFHQNYMKQGAQVAESSSKFEVNSAISQGKPLNALGGENQTVSSNTSKLDEKSYLVQNSSFIPFEYSRASVLDPHPSSLESATNSWNHQKPYHPSFEKSFQHFDYSMNNCVSVTRSSPSLVIKPPATVPSETSNFIGNNIAASKSEEPSSKDQERGLDTNRLSFDLERNDPIYVPLSSLRNVELPKKLVTKDDFDSTSKASSGFKVPDINAPYGSTLTVDSGKAGNSTDSSSDSLDHHNPAEDSPCWKGAPSSHFPSFEDSRAATSHNLMKTFEASFGANPEGTQILSPYTDDSVRVSLQKLYESSVYLQNGCPENGSSLSPNRPKDRGSDDDGLHSYNDIEKPRKVHDLPRESKNDADLKPSQPKEPSLKECDTTSKINLKSQSGIAGVEMNTNDASADGCVPFCALKNVLCMPSGEDALKLAKPRERESALKMNPQMLTNALHNLSELLLSHCSNDACALSEHDNESLKHAINNLEACLSKNMVPVTSNRESTIPQKGISHKLGELSDLGEGASASGKKVDKFWDFLFLKDDADTVRDDKMVQDIKEVLTENFQGEEDEKQSQTLLYKNLWLEAEAALCALNCRARFDRVKIEMEKCNLQKEKDVSEDTSAEEKVPSIEVSVPPDLIVTRKSTPEVKDCQIPEISSQNSPPSSSTTVHVDDVESLVMARFNILKSRGENSNYTGMETKKLSEVVGAGFEGKRIHWPVVGDQSETGSFGSGLGSHVQYHAGSYFGSPRLADVKEFRVCVSDDETVRYSMVGNQQRPSGLNDSSSSEWEHVLKEDILWQN